MSSLRGSSGPPTTSSRPGTSQQKYDLLNIYLNKSYTKLLEEQFAHQRKMKRPPKLRKPKIKSDEALKEIENNELYQKLQNKDKTPPSPRFNNQRGVAQQQEKQKLLEIYSKHGEFVMPKPKSNRKLSQQQQQSESKKSNQAKESNPTHDPKDYRLVTPESLQWSKEIPTFSCLPEKKTQEEENENKRFEQSPEKAQTLQPKSPQKENNYISDSQEGFLASDKRARLLKNSQRLTPQPSIDHDDPFQQFPFSHRSNQNPKNTSRSIEERLDDFFRDPEMIKKGFVEQDETPTHLKRSPQRKQQQQSAILQMNQSSASGFTSGSRRGGSYGSHNQIDKMNQTFSNHDYFQSMKHRMKVAYRLDQKSILGKYNPLIVQGIKKYTNGVLEVEEYGTAPVPYKRDPPTSLDSRIRFHQERNFGLKVPGKTKPFQRPTSLNVINEDRDTRTNQTHTTKQDTQQEEEEAPLVKKEKKFLNPRLPKGSKQNCQTPAREHRKLADNGVVERGTIYSETKSRVRGSRGFSQGQTPSENSNISIVDARVLRVYHIRSEKDKFLEELKRMKIPEDKEKNQYFDAYFPKKKNKRNKAMNQSGGSFDSRPSSTNFMGYNGVVCNNLCQLSPL